MEKLSPPKQNGVNVGQVGVLWPERTLIEDAVNAEHGYLEDLTVIRNLSRDQPVEVEDVLSLTYAAPLQMNRAKAEHLLRYFMDLLGSKENSFRGNREPKVMAHILLRILRCVNRHKYPGLDESRWPLSLSVKSVKWFVELASLKAAVSLEDQPSGEALNGIPRNSVN